MYKAAENCSDLAMIVIRGLNNMFSKMYKEKNEVSDIGIATGFSQTSLEGKN